VASSQDAYPAKPIRLIVPFAPGGAVDVIARIVAKGASERLGQPMIIENRGGAGGGIGADAVARAAPDGYTLLMGSTATMAINPSIYKSLTYDPVKSFAPIAMVAQAPHVIVVASTSPYKTVESLVSYAKANPDAATFGSGGVGTPTHLAGELFAQRTGIKMRHIPYKGSGPALTDLMGRLLTVQIDSLPAVLGFIKGGRLRALAQTGPARAASLPDVPTAAEAGVAGFDVTGWFGLFAPAGTSSVVVQRLNKAINATMADPATRLLLAQQGAEPGGGSDSQFDQYVRSDISRWAVVVKTANVQAD
jgi:tripartite-type tricarboxylate transporter receptor subunit TctC